MDIENPSAIYMAGRREWNERHGSDLTRARQWMAACFFAMALAAVSTGCAVWLAAQSKVEPFLVEKSNLGEAVAVHRLPPAPPPNSNDIKSHLQRWIGDVRSVYGDTLAERNIGTEAYDFIDRQSDALNQLNAWFAGDNQPFKRALVESVGVVVQGVGQIGNDTYQADFKENHITKDGNPPRASCWRITMRIRIKKPTDEQTILKNPEGIYITWFQASEKVGVKCSM